MAGFTLFHTASDPMCSHISSRKEGQLELSS